MVCNFRKIFIIFSFGAISATSFSQELFIKEKSPDLSMLSEITTKNTVGGYPIPNIGYPLKFAVANVSYSTGTGSGVPLGTLSLLSFENDKFILALDIKSNLNELSSVGDWTDEPCKREDYIYKRSTGGVFRNINCLSINHHVNFLKNPKGKYQQLLRELREKNIVIPATVIAVQLTRYSDRGRRLQYTFFINPEFYGLKAEDETIWGANGWHHTVIKKDPLKIDFIEKLKIWGNKFQDQMNNAFSKEPSPLEQGLDLRSFILKSSEKSGKSDLISLEDKLNELKTLYEKKLIPKEIYDDRINKLISNQ